MAKCNIDIEFTSTSSDIIEKAQTAILKAKGEFRGDASSGKFSIPVFGSDIEGNYTIDGSVFHIQITDKPLLISCRRIEDELREYIQQVG